MAGHDRLTDEGKQFFAQIKELEKLQVRIGFQAGDSDAIGEDGEKIYGKAGVRGKKGKVVDSDKVTILDVAMWNELGTSRAPSRPFLRQSVDDNADKISALCKAQLKRLAKGATAQEVLQQIGVVAKGLVQDKIESGTYAANAKSTIDKYEREYKTRDKKPLIVTSRMRQSVSFVIKPKGEGEE